MGIKVSEELKEALLKAKGQPCSMVLTVQQDGRWDVKPNSYTIEKEDGGILTLKEILPLPPSETKKLLVEEILNAIRPQIKKDIENGVKAALLEKTDEQLKSLQKEARETKLERKRGCFWLITPNEEVIL